MGLHVIVGKGPVGTTTADLLAAQGHRVRVLSRSADQSGARPAAVEHVAVDASDADAVRAATAGADVIYNCVNPAYHRWATDWPPMAHAILDAAEAHGAVLVIMSNLYVYGPVAGPMTEDLPLIDAGKGGIRARMWAEAQARHQAGRVRVAEARASDFVGPRVLANGHLGERVVPAILRGQGVRLLGNPNQPHSWTFIPDVARALVRLGADERAWGSAWHVPTDAPMSQREAIGRLCAAAGVPPVRVGRIPWSLVRAASVVDKQLGELLEIRYQFDRPFVLDSSRYTRTFGDGPTPLDESLSCTVAWWRERLEASASTAVHV